jgi:hypothetical protein
MKKNSLLSYPILFLFTMLIDLSATAHTSVPFTFTTEGHILVDRSINGVAGKFIFDTGAGMTAISKKYADKVNSLIKQEAGFTGIRETGEKLSIDLYRGKSLLVGPFMESNPQMGVIDSDFGPCDGLISLKSFSNQPVTIDYEHQEIIFETPASISHIEKTGHIIPLQMDISRDKTLDIFAYFKVNDKIMLQLLIDSGAGKDVYL